MKINLRKKLQNLDQFEFLLNSVLALFPIAFLSFMISGYKGNFFSEQLSIFIADGWCTLPAEGIGDHCFGDYGFPRSTEYNSELFSQPSLYASNTPLTILIFIVLKALSYNVGLVIYLLTLVISVCLPIWLAAKGKSLVVRLTTTIFLGLLSIGSITAVDRGNHVLILVPMIYIFLTATNKKIQLVSLFMIINLKFWGIIFLIILLSQKRFKDFFIVVISSIIFNLITLQLLAGSTFNALKNIFISITSKGYADHIQQYSISIFGFIRRTNCLLFDNLSCNGAYELIPFSAILIFYMFAFFCVVTSFIYAQKSELALSIRFAPTLICTFLLVPEAPIYQISMVMVIISLLARDRKQLSLIERKLVWAMILPLIISTVPLSINWTPTLLLPPQRFFYWIYPSIWSFVIIYFIYVYFTKLRKKAHK
jgi:hypothetical protein